MKKRGMIMSGFPRQNEIDVYYENKKKEVGEWLIEYAGDQKRLTQEQRRRLLAYAERMSFSTAGEANAYVQGLKTVGKKNKQKMFDYMQRVDWFPEGINVGVLVFSAIMYSLSAIFRYAALLQQLSDETV